MIQWRWCVAVMIVLGGCAANHSRNATRESTFVDPVYQRYAKKVMPSVIKYDLEALRKWNIATVASSQDVKEGRAVFTLEGLGERRVWKMPEGMYFAHWVPLRQFPVQASDGSTHYDTFGCVIQAEELRVNGTWKRYLGFVMEQGAAVVPAEEVDLSLQSETEGILWQELPGGLDWGVKEPHPRDKKGGEVRNLGIGDALPVEVYVRNRRAVTKHQPVDLYHGHEQGGPALRRGVKLQMSRAPFNPRTPYAHYPSNDDFTALTATRTATFQGNDEGRLLAPEEVVKVMRLDLRDWFDLSATGYYEFHFEFDKKELGLPEEEDRSRVSFQIVIGTEPRRMTIAELNREIPPLGGKGAEERIAKLIEEICTPPVEHRGKAGRLAFPANFPQLNPHGAPFNNMSGRESMVTLLLISNRDLLNSLDLYKSAGVKAEFEKRMKQEKPGPMKMLLAAIAAENGSRKAARYLLEEMKSTDYLTRKNLHDVLGEMICHHEQKQPGWLVAMAEAALTDERYCTGMEKANYSSDTVMTIAYVADEDGNLPLALGHVQCRAATEFLIEQVRRKPTRMQIMALGSMGDARAIPVLIEVIKANGGNAKYDEAYGLSPEIFQRAVESLANLKAKEAVPVLLEYIQFPDVIEALGLIGDKRAAAALKKIAESGSGPKSNIIKAKIATALLAEDPVAQLCGLMGDTTFEEFDRRDLVWRLGDYGDPRAIPYLIKAIKHDPSGAVVNQSIIVMSVFKYKAAVQGLIECFDCDYKGKTDWKRAYKPEMFQENIAESLQKITGKQFGNDKKRWVEWWEKKGRNSKKLK